MNLKFWRWKIWDNKQEPLGSFRALIFGFLFVIIVLLVDFLVLILYKNNIDTLNQWSGLDIPDIPDLDFKTATTISIGVFAVFTLGVAVWRSTISSMQVEEQRKQGKQTEKQGERTERQLQLTEKQLANTSEQIKLAEEQLKETQINNLTNLLEKGTELISNKQENTDEKKLIGVSILQQVALKNNGLFNAEVKTLLLTSIVNNTVFKPYISTYKWKALNALYDIRNEKEFIYCDDVTIEGVFNIFYKYFGGINYYCCGFLGRKDFYPTGRYFDCEFENCHLTGIINAGGNTTFKRCRIKGVYLYEKSIFMKTTTSKDSFDFYFVDFTNCDVFKVNCPTTFVACTYDPDQPIDENLRVQIDEANRVTEDAHSSPPSSL